MLTVGDDELDVRLDTYSICYIIYRDYVIICVLAVGVNELTMGDDNNVSSGIAIGRHV